MRVRISFVIGAAICAIFITVASASVSLAGSLEPSSAPAPTMHTLEEIYNKLVVIEQKLALLISIYTGSTGSTAIPFTSSTATSFGATKVDLTWAAKGVLPDAFNIYRSASSGTIGTKIATTTGNTTTFEDSGLTPGTTYYYTIESVTAGGPSVKSQQVTATTGAIPSFPAPVTGLTAVRNGNLVTLSWDNYTGAVSYDLYRSIFPDIPCGMWGSMTDIGGAFVTSVNDTIAGNGRYTYCVGVYDSTETQSAYAQVTIDVPEGTLPGVEAPLLNVWSSTKDLSVVHLYWWAAPGAEAHHIYAAPGISGGGIPQITPKQGGTGIALDVGLFAIPIYQVSPGYYGMDVPLGHLSPGYTWFAVEAVRGSYAADSEAIGILVSAPAPVGVTNVRTAQWNPTTLNLSWDPVAEAASYKVYRLNSTFEAISSANLVGTTSEATYRDTGLIPATNYFYRVTAIAAGQGGQGGGAESGPSDYAFGKTFSDIGPESPLMIPFLPGQGVLTWTSRNIGTTFNIYQCYENLHETYCTDFAYLYGNWPMLQTSLDPSTGSPWRVTVSAPLDKYALFLASFGLDPVRGYFWIKEVFPDGTTAGLLGVNSVFP